MNIIHNLAFLLLFQLPFAFDQALECPQSSPLPERQQQINRNIPGAANIIFKSTDGGQTWQDISEGLPEDLQEYGFQRDGFYTNDSGLYLRAGNGIYRNKANSTAPFWNKDIFPGEHNRIAPGRTGTFAYNHDGQFLQKINGPRLWSPMFTTFKGNEVRTVFETAGGTVLIGCNKGLFKSTDSGKTWKQVHTWGWVMKLVESNGVLLATSEAGIIRSTDDGENWDWVISEGGVGIAIERINGGFAAITCNTESMTRRVRTSYDGGKTWQPIDASLPPSLLVASIIQAGDYFFCGHPDGIFRYQWT